MSKTTQPHCNPHLQARILSSEPKSTGFLKVSAFQIEADLHEGGSQQVMREVMARGDAVGILAYDPHKDLVILVNEMRPGLLVNGDYPYATHVAAGGIEKGESALDAAAREAREELNLPLSHTQIMHDRIYVSSGGTSERITMIFGIVKAPDPTKIIILGNQDEGENIRLDILPARAFMNMLKTDEIKDFKTLTAAYWLKEHRAALRKAHRPT